MLPPVTVTGGWVPEHDEAGAPGRAPDGVVDGVPGGTVGASRPGEPQPGWRVSPAAAGAALGLACVVALVSWSRTAGAGEVMDVPARPVASAAVAAAPAVSGAVGAPGGPVGTVAPSGAPGGPASSTVAGIVVDVQGRVRRPGLVRLPAGARVADAVRAAGGAAPGAAIARVNLARPLTDGEQVLVPGPGDPVPAAPAGPAGGPGSAPGSGSGAPVDLNTATVEGLDALPGVGPVLAARIVAWRTAHGRFTSVDELGEVPGIGPKALERLRPLVRV